MKHADESFQEIIGHNYDINFQLTLDGEISYISPSCTKILGYSTIDLVGKSFQSIINPDDINIYINALQQLTATGKILGVELRVKHKAGHWYWFKTNAAILKDTTGRALGIVGVARDINDLMLTHFELIKKTEELERFFSVNLDFLCIISSDGTIIRANKSWENLGYTTDYLQGGNVKSFIHPMDFYRTIKEITKQKHITQIKNIITRVMCNDGSFRFIEWRAQYSENLYYASGRDITERIKLENDLNNKNEQFELANKGSNDCIWDWNIVTNELYLSPKWTNQFGYINNTVPRQFSALEELIHPEDKEIFIGILNNYLKGCQSIFDAECRLVLNNGGYIWIWVRGEALRDKNGNAYRMAGSLTDITERKEIIKLSQEREKYLRTILETTQDAVVVISDDGVITDVNESFYKMTGYTKDELSSIQLSEILSNENPADTQKRITQLHKGESVLFETTHRKKDGTNFDVEVSATCLSRNPLAWVSFIRDITDRKKAEESILHSRDLLRYIIEHCRSAVAIQDNQDNYMFVSNSFLETYRVVGINIIGKKPTEIFPHLPERYIDTNKRVLKGEIIFQDNDQYIYEDGSSNWVRWESRPWYEKDGSIGGAVLYAEIITERKLVEQMLYNEKEYFKTTILSVGDGVITTDKLGLITMMNPLAEQLTGWENNEAIGVPLEKVLKIINESTKQPYDTLVKEILQSGKIIEYNQNALLISKTENELPVEISAAPIKDSNGNIAGVVCIIRDFTERKAKQEEIEFLSYRDYLTELYNRRFMEDSLKKLDNIEHLPLSLVVIDVNGLKLTNDAFGHEAGDRLLMNVAEILRKVCGPEYIAGRMGGDEFCILLPHTDSEQARAVKQKIIAETLKLNVEPIIISLAIGYATKYVMDRDIKDIIAEADNYMYKVKLKHGKIMRSQTIDMVLNNINTNYDREQIHTEKVSHYCEFIAKALNFSVKEVEDIKTAGALHDIGKIMVPPQLLSKAGKLSKDEFEIIQRHPEIGYQIIKSVDEYVHLSDFVLYHHERWDGSGYPQGLSGENIPVCSRIIAVADAFEAMTATRPYQKTKTKAEAIIELNKCAGTQFDAEIVKVFIEKVLLDPIV